MRHSYDVKYNRSNQNNKWKNIWVCHQVNDSKFVRAHENLLNTHSQVFMHENHNLNVYKIYFKCANIYWFAQIFVCFKNLQKII